MFYTEKYQITAIGIIMAMYFLLRHNGHFMYWYMYFNIEYRKT